MPISETINARLIGKRRSSIGILQIGHCCSWRLTFDVQYWHRFMPASLPPAQRKSPSPQCDGSYLNRAGDGLGPLPLVTVTGPLKGNANTVPHSGSRIIPSAAWIE